MPCEERAVFMDDTITRQGLEGLHSSQSEVRFASIPLTKIARHAPHSQPRNSIAYISAAADRTAVKPPSSLELPFLRKLPPEVWQLIGSFLALADADSLAFSCKFMAHTLGTQSWCDLQATEISENEIA